MSLVEAGPAERHRLVAGTFGERVGGVRDWGAPSPVAGWAARDVVGHLVGWFPAFLESGAGICLDRGPDAADDPVGAWQVHADAVQALLDDPDTASRVLRNRHVGEVPLAEAVDRFYTADVFMHTWDLARASQQDDRLDPLFCQHLLDGMRPLDAVLRASGQYGPARPVPEGGDVTDRLVAFIGRDPEWERPGPAR